ncbi:hypothetical protein HYU91_03060 [Candidatus Collierbacteria bacterium]|nr:hypothetical protein [Candidatus Collierbacteria bacterium]
MKSILILEDDLETLAIIFRVLTETKIDFAPIVLSTYEQVEKFVNPSDMNFDLILLDRDCALGGSFHALDIKKFGPDKIIGISSVPQYNLDLLKLGVKTIITKDYKNLDLFASNLLKQIITMELA